jgi:hypothetical protein
MLTQADLKKLFNYNPETGEFIKLISTGCSKVGNIAGCLDKHGYITIRISGKNYSAHRLAWLYVYGYFPENSLDHENRKGTDNRICNLREVSNQCNMRNSKIHCDNKSGFKGVFRSSGKWQAQIRINKIAVYLGKHSTFLEAALHRLAAEQCLSWGDCDSQMNTYKKILSLGENNV